MRKILRNRHNSGMLSVNYTMLAFSLTKYMENTIIFYEQHKVDNVKQPWYHKLSELVAKTVR